MAVTENSYTGNGSQTNFPFTFPYLKSTDVQVQVDAAVTTAWSFANATTVQFNTAPSNGAKIKILRDTNVDSLAATFYAGSSIKSEDLNDNYTQNLYKTQEVGARYFSNTGGTMTGDLTLAEDVELIFEGATDDAHETKLTVADPTADRTITLPDVSGTVVTTGDTGTVATGMIAADAVNGTKIADDSINSEHYVDGSIDTQHIADSQITTAKIADNQVTTAKIVDSAITGNKIASDAIIGSKIAADSIDSVHYVAGSVDTTAIASNAVTTAKIADNNVTTAKIAAGAVTNPKLAASAVSTPNLASGAVTNDKVNANADIAGSKLADGGISTAKIANDAVTTAKIADGAVNTPQIADGHVTEAKLATAAVTQNKIATNVIDANRLVTGSVITSKILDGNVTTSKLAAGAVTTDKIGADAVTNAKIANDSIDSEHYVDGSIDTAHLGNTQVTDAKLASNAVTTSKITDANVTEAKLASNSVTISKIGCEQTTISDSDSHIPTSGAVVDYVAAQIAPLGGLEVVATEVAFPNTQPASGVVISISDAGGVVVNGSGVSTTGRTVGGSTVTINGFPSSLQSSTLAAGIGLLVSSTGSSQTYNYHKILGKEADITALSDDINDFNNRYRTGGSAPTSSLDNGDLWFDTTNGKMMVYNGANTAWEEVSAVGSFNINTLSSSGSTGGGSATFNGTAYRFTLSNPPQDAQQLLVSVNGVIQKPNSGTSQPSEGFAISGNDIIFSAAPNSGAPFFIVTLGQSVQIGAPSDGSVTTAKLTSGSVTTAKIADNAVTGDKIATTLILPDNNKISFGDGQDLQIHHDGSNSGINDKGTGSLYIQGSNNIYLKDYDTGENHIVMTKNGSVDLYHNGSKKFETASHGVSIAGNLDFPDNTSGNASLRFGNSQDFFMNHNGSDSYIINNTGDLYIRDLNGDVHIQGKDNEESIIAKADGAVEIYYNNSKKFETTSTGVAVTGALTVAGTAAQTGTFQSNQSATTISILDTDGDGLNISGGSAYGHRIHTNNTEKLELGVNGSTKLVLQNDGNVGIGLTNPVNNLDVSGSISATGNMLNTAYADGVYLGLASGNAAITSGKANTSSYLPIVFRQDRQNAGIECMRILAGGGLTFNGDTAAANALDDYEEGTWTPVYSPSNGASNVSYSAQVGDYVKVGRLVMVQFYMNYSCSSSSGNARISGLPFNPQNYGAGSVMMQNLDTDSTRWYVCHTSGNSNNLIYFYGTQDNGNWESLLADNNAALLGTISYLAPA